MACSIHSNLASAAVNIEAVIGLGFLADRPTPLKTVALRCKSCLCKRLL